MKTAFRRSLCAALSFALVPAAAHAAPEGGTPYNAVVAGLAIPSSASSASLSARSNVSSRSVVIDAASAKLFMMEGGRIVDEMRVIVGKKGSTPELNTSLTYTTLNPYWHAPPDLAQSLIAPRVLAEGFGYLKAKGYQVVSRFSDDAEVLDPKSVDWKAVAAGRKQVFIRQLPGPDNSMGRMKFSLASGGSIYLHDTPKKALFAEDNRSLSNGCVRLEDAPRFARWLLGRDPGVQSGSPEQHVALPRAVPITITYLDPAAQTQLAALR